MLLIGSVKLLPGTLATKSQRRRQMDPKIADAGINTLWSEVLNINLAICGMDNPTNAIGPALDDTDDLSIFNTLGTIKIGQNNVFFGLKITGGNVTASGDTSLSYFLEGEDSSDFVIDDDGRIKTAKLLDYDQKSKVLTNCNNA